MTKWCRGLNGGVACQWESLGLIVLRAQRSRVLALSCPEVDLPVNS